MPRTGGVDRRGGLARVRRDAGVGRIVLARVAGRVGVGDVATGRGTAKVSTRTYDWSAYAKDVHGDIVRGGLGGALAQDEAAPGLVALVDDLGRVLLVLGLAREGEVVLGLAVGDLVDAEPLVRRADEAGELALDVLDVVHAARERVAHVDDDHLPVRLALVEERHDAEHLDLLHLADIADLLTDLADVEGIVVTLGLGLGVLLGRVFPGLSGA